MEHFYKISFMAIMTQTSGGLMSAEIRIYIHVNDNRNMKLLQNKRMNFSFATNRIIYIRS